MRTDENGDLGRPVENNEFTGAREHFPRHDFVAFHETRLPELIESHGGLVVDDVAALEPISLQVDEASFVYSPAPRGVRVRPGSGPGAAVRLGAEAFSDFVNEIHSVSGLAMGGKLSFERGQLADLHRWEPALRALYSGRPIWTPAAAADLVDSIGDPLDLLQTFGPEDEDEAMLAFLRTAGFLHVRGVFAPEEVDVLGAELERVRAALEPGKGDCWWSTTSAGEQVVTRINYLDRWSARLADCGFDERVQRLGRLVGDELRVCSDRLDGPMAFVKNSNVAQGLGDLQWHQDDGLGGHPVMCPLMQVGVQLDHANAENGQLWVLAGSHRYSNHPLAWGEEGDGPVARIVTEPGDVTVHYGDLYHTTPPPTGPNAGRRVLYFKFAPPQTFEIIPAGAHYNDVLFKAGAQGRVATRAETWSEDDSQEEMESRIFGE
jgi:hypothetical protein